MIARTFYRRGIIETWGRGTLKIARLMRDAGNQPPTVSLRPGAVVVAFGLPVASAPETPQKLPEAILLLLRGQPELSSAQIALLLGKSESAVKRATRKLRQSGRLTRIGPAKGGYWKVIE